MSKPDIRSDHFKIVQDILNKNLSSDVKVWVYGSRAKWTTLDSSDLDLALESKDTIDDNIINHIKRDFEESDLPYEVDVVDMAAAQSFFKDVINKDKVLLDRSAKIKAALKYQKGWREVKLGDICPFIYGRGLSEKLRNKSGNIPVYGSNGIIGTHSVAYVQSKGIIIGRKGTVGAIHLSETPFWPIDTTFYILKESESDLLFIYYLLKSLPLSYMNSDSAVPGLNRENAHALKVTIPESKLHRAKIATVLYKIDCLINKNINMNKMLEGMAQAIFKSWFVDFDPVYAKRLALDAGLSEGQAERAAMAVIAGVCSPEGFVENFRQMDRSLNEKFSKINESKKYELIYKASLFPSEFVNSKLGLIPKGWKESNIENEFNITMGQSPKGTTYNQSREGVLFFQGRKDFGFRFPKERMFTKAPNRMARAGDTLISVRAPVGDKNIAIKDCCIGRGLASLRHKSNGTPYTYYFISYIEKSLDSLSGSGTVFNSITKNILSNIKIIAPSTSIIDRYNNMIKSFDDRIMNLFIENNYLSSFRDTLLPKLLSGEIDISKIKIKEKV